MTDINEQLDLALANLKIAEKLHADGVEILCCAKRRVAHYEQKLRESDEETLDRIRNGDKGGAQAKTSSMYRGRHQ